jgi:pyruvate dehydrogenase E1 component alpha subunit
MTPAERVGAMLRIRRFEEQCYALHKSGELLGHYHVYIGQEATAVAACAALASEDFLFTTWRNHGHLLARGAAPERMFAEILGRTLGYARGKSGTLHMAVRELGVPSTSALVGGNLPLAVGSALACKRRGSGMTVCFFGDAGLEEGAAFEAMLLAAAWKVPLLFVCENNSVPPEQRKRGGWTSSTLTAAQLQDVPLSLQIPSQAVDGADSDALHACFARLASEVRAGAGPRFVEVRCTRWPGNSMAWPALPGGEWQTDWAFGGRPQDAELALWLASDPLARYLQEQVAAGAVGRSQIEAIDARARAEMADAVESARASPFPAPGEAYEHVWTQRRAAR